MSLWLCANDRPVPKRESFGIMGICNLTPDSFYDGGTAADPEAAAARCGSLLEQGADILDLGAESTRPGSSAVNVDEECRRLLPVIERVRREFSAVALSVDTRNARTARLALDAGCDIINDVSACRHDAKLLDVVAEMRPGYVLMHSRGEPATMQENTVYADVVAEVRTFFESGLERLAAAGLPENHVALDPGIGFGKTLAHNLDLLSHIDEFLQFGRPLLCGVSMKGFFGKLLGLPLEKRGLATAVASALLYAKGVVWHRVHKPEEVKVALSLAQALEF